MAQPDRTTVVIVTKDDPEQPGEDLMRALESLQQQTLWDMMDTHIVRDVGDFPINDLRLLGAERADTPYVAFMAPDDVWPEDFLERMFEEVPDAAPAVAMQRAGRLSVLAEREWLLAQMPRETSE